MVNFIKADQQELIITTKKVISTLDLSTIKKYIKNVDIIDSVNIMSPQLSQSKSYLKILDISYFIENTNVPITSSIVENIIKTTHIFNDICLTSKPYIIKASFKSDMVVIWIDI